MGSNIGLEDIGSAVLQELWKEVIHQIIKVVNEAKGVVLEKDSFLEFSRSISKFHSLLTTLDPVMVEAAMGSESTISVLETLNNLLEKTCMIIKDNKSKSRLSVLVNSQSMLLQMQVMAKDIANTISLFKLANLDIALNIKTMMNEIINNLKSMEFRSAFATETITSQIENLISQDNKNRESALNLLENVSEAIGAREKVSLVKNELALLKKEKEEMELQKKEAEALQLSQLIQFLYSTEIVTMTHDNEASMSHQHDPFESFICPLSKKMMTDPVAIDCGHSFERAAIEEHFRLGEKKCPECRQELTSMDLTSNLWLRNSIEEWKHRDMDLKFRAAVYGLKSDDQSRKNKALEEMQCLMEMSQYAVKVVEEGLTSTFVESVRDNTLNVGAALKCLYYLAKYNDNHKKAIVEAGAIRRIVKHIYRGGKESDAISVLLELSEKEILREKIGNTKDCIPFLVSLLQNNNSEVSHKAQKVLKNLSSNTHFVVKMAEAGYFQPFVVSFNQGSQETRAWMAAAFINMELKDNNIKDLKDKQFTHNLIQMLCTSFPACKITCLKSIKKLLAYPKMVKQLLKNHITISNLLGIISYAGSDASLKQEAAEVLALLVGASQHLKLEENQGLRELQSNHIVSLLLQIVATSDDQSKIQFFHLLAELSYKSETVRNLIQSDEEAITNIFFSLHSDHPMVKRWAMKLIYYLSEGDSGGVPLPSSFAKETAVNTLVSILSSSPNIEERSIAAGIISRLPSDDIVVDEILRKSEALKAIYEVICTMDEENSENISPASPSTSLLENALAALLRYTEPTKLELQKQLGKLELYPVLVRVLSRGSSIAKQRTAIAFAQLSSSTSMLISNNANKNDQTKPLLDVMKIFPWCCSSSLDDETLCSIHGYACSPRDTFCLVKADAVKPLVRTLSETESGAAEAALIALETLLTDHSTLSRATSAIVDNQGVEAILKVLEKGTISAKIKALDLYQKILKHTPIDHSTHERCQRILIQFLQDDSLKKRAALVLGQMGVIPYQSSYF